MINFRIPFFGLICASRLVRMDTTAVYLLENSAAAFWSSMRWSAGLALPFYLLLIMIRFDPANQSEWHYFTAKFEIYALAWLVFPFVMERVCLYLKREKYTILYLSAYNWLNCLYNIMFLLIGLALASHMLTWEIAVSLSLGLMCAGTVWIGYMTRKILQLPFQTVIAIMMIELFINIMLDILSVALVTAQT